MTVIWSWDLQAYISGAWTSISRDVEILKSPLTASRGILGSSVLDRIASPGSLTCSLDNGESNSGTKLGYYSPDHANMRANFGRDTALRLKITYSGTDYYKWKGYITDLQPGIGKYRERSSILTATDYMQKLSEHKLKQIASQENKRSDQLVDAVLDNIYDQPVNISLETGKFTMPYGLTTESDERTTALGVLQKICQSALGYVFIKGNTTDGETLVYESEETRSIRSSAATLNDTMSEMRINRRLDDVKNKIIGVIHPVRTDADSTTLLYDLEREFSIPPLTTITINLPFKDPQNLSERVSAKNVVTPLVAGTHYRMSSKSDTGSGDLNGSLTVTPTVGANSVKAQLQNTAAQTGYVDLIKIFGQGIYYYSPIELFKEGGDADKVLTVDFYYLSDIHRGGQFLIHLFNRASATTTVIESVKFYADIDSTLMGYAMSRDIGDRVTITESATGLNGQYSINSVAYTIEPNGSLGVEWGLEPGSTQTYFILNSSLLNGAHVLSPF
jgi:hypothetical protein